MPGRRVTIAVSDLKSSTALAERFDSETLRTVLRRYFDEMTIVYEAHGGVVAKIIGDAILTVFDGSTDPAGAALRATRAATDAQAALTWLNDGFESTWGVRLANRIGIASGAMPRLRDERESGSEVLAGPVLTVAETLEAAAPTMEVLIDRETFRLCGDDLTAEPFGAVDVVGADEAVAAWRVVGVDWSEGTPDRVESVRPCDLCGSGNDFEARWCGVCGSVLIPLDEARETRRMVTILFAGPRAIAVEGGSPTPAAIHLAMARYDAVMRPILERHGATVEKFIGDASMAVFGLPVRHEDDPLRAARAAIEMRTALLELNVELRDRFGVRLVQPIGINTGPVVAGEAIDRQRLVTGDAVNVAARLEQMADSGQIVIGELTRRLIGPGASTEQLTPLRLKGKTEPVSAYRLVDLDLTGETRSHSLPLVGREAEIDVLRKTLRTAAREQQPRLVTVTGEAGLGKSRLIHEFLTEAERTTRVLRGRCLAYGDGITFWALMQMVHEAAGIADDDDAETARHRIGLLVGDDPELQDRVGAIAGLNQTPYAVAELGWAMRALVERLAVTGPVVLFVDDIHWAEPTFLELIDRLASTVRGPVLILGSARPMAPEQRGRLSADGVSLVLRPLGEDQCERFLTALLDEAALDRGVVSLISGAAGGNPLFLEQFLSMLIDDGRLGRVDGQWRATGDLSTLEIPATIEALLTSRLDRLTRSERNVIEPSAVIGTEFPQEAVVALVDPDLRRIVPERLVQLVDRELLDVAPRDEPAFRFQHELIRDATYNGLLKQARAALHERLVRWMDAREETRDRGMELQEIQGYHLEQAYSYWRELGLVDERIAAMGIDAAVRLGDAGERALARGDMPAASSLLLRAAGLVPPDHATKPRLLLLAGGALDEAGAFDRAMTAFDESEDVARAAGDAAGVEAARLARLRLDYLTGRVTDAQHVADEAEAALHRLRQTADADALSRAWQLRFNVDAAACRWSAAQHAAEQVIEHARAAGNAALERSMLRSVAFLAQKGPMPVAEATAVCREILEQVATDRRSTATTSLDLAILSAMERDFEAARLLCVEARSTLTELGADIQAALVSLTSGPVELLADEPARGEAELRRDREALERMGERNFIALTSALLAEAIYRQGRFMEASELIASSREVAAPDDLAVQIVAGCVEGKLAARRGDVGEAVELVRESVRLIETTEDPSGQADALLDLAETLHLAGDHGAGLEAAGAARDRYLAKGNLAGADRAVRILGRLQDQRDPLDDGRPG